MVVRWSRVYTRPSSTMVLFSHNKIVFNNINHITYSASMYSLWYRYRLNTQLEDDSGKTIVTLLGKTTQILIQKSCHVLTFVEGYTDQALIPPEIERLKGLHKIFQVYLKPHRAITGIIVSKIFEDQLQEKKLPSFNYSKLRSASRKKWNPSFKCSKLDPKNSKSKTIKFQVIKYIQFLYRNNILIYLSTSLFTVVLKKKRHQHLSNESFSGKYLSF